MSGTCGICGGLSDRVRAFAEATELHRCRSCRCEFLFPQPTDDALAALYKDYFKRRTSNGQRVGHFRELLRRSGVELKGRSVLDVGAAEGDCCRAILELEPTARPVALEGNSESIPLMREFPFRKIHQHLEAWLESGAADTFDVILLFDVLEHLRDPADSLQQLVSSHLNPGGVVLASFPSAQSLSRRVLGRLWFQYKLEHLFYFSAESIDTIAEKAGLRTERLSALPKRLPLDYVLGIGARFGPTVVQKTVGLVHALVPRVIGRQSLPMYFGENLWIARKI